MKTKRCSKCKKWKLLDKYPPNVNSKRDGKQAACRVCINAWMKAHYERHPAEHMLRRAYSRAANKGMRFNITLEDILPLPTHCPVFGFRLQPGKGQQNPRAYSLDRINNKRGYVKGNVVVMSYLANRLKNNGTAEQHERIAAWMREHERASVTLALVKKTGK